MGLVLRAERLGVFDLLTLPLVREDFLRAIERLHSAATETPLPLPEPHAEVAGPYALVGQSTAMLEVYKVVARVAGSNATVLIQGESGTGKELVARAIHVHGPVAGGPFVAVNCAAICSATSAARSPARSPGASAASSRPPAVRCSSTRSPT